MHTFASEAKACEQMIWKEVKERLINLFQNVADLQDFREHWMPDSKVTECYECGLPFNTLRRRHHCRVCGQIFCSKSVSCFLAAPADAGFQSQHYQVKLIFNLGFPAVMQMLPG